MEKKFEIPELTIIQFIGEEIITASNEYDEIGENGDLDD